jgi:flotillin
VGEANAMQDQRIRVASANATAVEGENTAKITIAQSDSARRTKMAEAERLATASEKVQAAKALQESYAAEQTAEMARSERERATRTADIVIPSQIQKQKIEIEAEAQAEQTRRVAKGDADAILLKKQAEGQGIYEVLSKQAAGFDKLVEAANNNTRDAVLMLIADRLPEIVKIQVEAISNIKIDKVTVWDNLSAGADGKTPATANFLAGMLKSIPPLDDIFRTAGIELPSYLKGEENNVETEKPKDKTEE